ncbi:MAG: hypothetical protein NZM39_12295 [Bernardetiaceae bacterium]|nr:hypothetical protein [Bernardetiaceae bacterium]
MKKQIVMFILLITLFYAFNCVAEPPFRLWGSKFVLKSESIHLSASGDSLFRVRVFGTTVVRFDSTVVDNKIVTVAKRKDATVIVKMSVNLRSLGLAGKSITELTNQKIGRILTKPGIINSLSSDPGNLVNPNFLNNPVQIWIIGDGFQYQKEISDRAYKVLFEK